MAIVGESSRSRSSARASLLFAAVLLLLHADVVCGAGREQPQPRRQGPVMSVPGGTARLLQAVALETSAEPPRAFLAVIRTSYGQRTTTAATAAMYLQAVTHLAAARGRLDTGKNDAVAAFFEACGFDRRHRRPSTDDAVTKRVGALEAAGFPVGEWMAWWSKWSESPQLAADLKLKKAQEFAGALGPSDEIPALLPPELWSSAVFRRDVAASLAAEILADRRAALLYYGLFALDDETLSYVTRTPKLITALTAVAGQFAGFSDGIAVRNGRVEVPGGPAAAPLWDAVVGAPSSDPLRFLTALFTRGDGRLAWLFNAVGHLDPPHLAFALTADGKASIKTLADVFMTFDRGAALFADKPFARPTPDPGFILAHIHVSDDGTLAAPSDRGFWEAVLQPGDSKRPTGDPVNPLWIVAQIASRPAATRRMCFDAVLFAQRLAAKQSAASAPSFDMMVAAVTQFSTRSALMLTLERLGFVDPEDYVAFARKVDTLSTGDERRASLALAQFQGALAVIVRLRDVGAMTTTLAQDLARALCADAGGQWAVAAWFEGRLLPAVSKADGDQAPSLEDRMLNALAGVTAGRARPVIEWDGHPYRVDVAASERTRLRRIREQQGDVSVDQVVAFHRAAERLLGATTDAEVAAGLEQVRQAAADTNNLLAGGATLFGHALPRVPVANAAATVVARRFDASRSEAAQRLNEATDVLFADLLASLAYALAIGDPEAPSLLAGNPARRHDFALSMPSSVGWWRIAEEMNATAGQPGARRVIRGSMLALDRALGLEWLRPVSFDLPDVGRRMSSEEMRGLGEAVAALNGFRLTDQDAAELVAALARGRGRARDAAGLGQCDGLAGQAGVDGHRRRLISWVGCRDGDSFLSFLSLGEVLALGMEEPRRAELRGWGLPSRPIDGSLEVRLPHGLAWQQMAGRSGSLVMSAQVLDLQLHILETVVDLRLPASLTPTLLAYASWDVAMNAPMTDADDWLALVRTGQAVSRDRIADYVWAVTGVGALVPVDVK